MLRASSGDWSPVVDGVELLDHPGALVERGEVARTPILIGANKDEGTMFSGFPTASAATTTTTSSSSLARMPLAHSRGITGR